MTNPDGSWAWLVCASSSVLRFLTNGMTFTFGILVIEFTHEFQANTSEVVLIGSLQITCMFLSGLFSDVMNDRFGWRMVAIAGSVIGSSGIVISSFVSNLYVMYITFTLLSLITHLYHV